MAAQDKNLNALFLPYFITSHMTPLVDTAVLFASRPGVAVTILTTPSNALMFQPSVDRAASAGHRITFHTLKFPAAEVGLPEGIENYGSIASRDMIPKVTLAISLLREPMAQAIRDLRPDCIVSDVMDPWTVDVAEELNIPRLILSTTNCFSECAYHQLKIHKPYEKVRSDSESFVVPGLPDEIEMTSAQLEDYLKTPEDSGNSGEMMNRIEDAETRSYGIVFTSFSEIEPEYVQHSKNVMGRKSWHVGLPSLILGKENETNADLIRFPDTQFTEIALALEESGRPFVWVVRKIGKTGEKEDEDWLPEGFRERFYNEKLITRVLKIGVEVGSGVWNRSPQILSPVVGKDKIVKAVSRLMDGSEEAEEIRRRAKEVSVMMKKSAEEGGSSSSDLNNLIEELKAYVLY
ncbi:hypothetical protein RHSIM_Rhsim06G0054200 [Rhododendron simsii]|uniref:Uncharacterized protein n=1 Tax=Rhododendron simsii TaxID=118357 RepID=A0A834GVN4_RHOSS|nr:hypothetical protein RHSIM_Rhsim06G0054200 [Rhododendron simsii]